MTETSPFKLSAIDVLWPGHIVDLVPQLDALGYHRYWATEHYGPNQCASPTLLAGLAAGLAEGIRVGTAGVLLHFQSPFKVAEDFRLLELFFPGRIDLGVASAFPGGPVREALLDGRPGPEEAAYAFKVAELTRLVRRIPADNGNVNTDLVGPQSDSVPEIWVCGLRPRSAELAGRLGTAYAFHDFIHRNSGRALDDGPSVLAAYRSAFRPAPEFHRPLTNVACYGICADTQERARELWRAEFASTRAAGPRLHPELGAAEPEPCFLGTPEQCRDQLRDIRQRYGADELVIQSLTHDVDARRLSYKRLAEAFELPARTSS